MPLHVITWDYPKSRDF